MATKQTRGPIGQYIKDRLETEDLNVVDNGIHALIEEEGSLYQPDYLEKCIKAGLDNEMYTVSKIGLITNGKMAQ